METYFVCGFRKKGGVCGAVRALVQVAGKSDFAVTLGKNKVGMPLDVTTFRVALHKVQKEFGIEYATRCLPTGELHCYAIDCSEG